MTALVGTDFIRVVLEGHTHPSPAVIDLGADQHLVPAPVGLEDPPDDLFSLVLNAQQGNRNEANRLTGLIDQRPFGYMILLQAIYYCACGAPFDLEAAPEFASLFSKSGLPWPPGRPIDFPLKDW